MKTSEQTLGPQTVGHPQHDTGHLPCLLVRMRPTRQPARRHGTRQLHTQCPHPQKWPAVPSNTLFQRSTKRLNTVRFKEFQQLPFSAHMFIHSHRNESPSDAIQHQHHAVQMEVSHG